MVKEIWMHEDKHGHISCHFNAIDPSSVLFSPAIRALNAEARIRDLEAASIFERYPVGTLFQKQADGRINAMSLSGEIETAYAPETKDVTP